MQIINIDCKRNIIIYNNFRIPKMTIFNYTLYVNTFSRMLLYVLIFFARSLCCHTLRAISLHCRSFDTPRLADVMDARVDASEISFFPGGRKPEERPTGRRSSFRSVKPVMPYEVGGEDESMMNLGAFPVSVVSPKVVPPPVLGPDEDRRTRRRGSQL